MAASGEDRSSRRRCSTGRHSSCETARARGRPLIRCHTPLGPLYSLTTTSRCTGSLAQVTRSSKQRTASGIEEFMSCLRIGCSVLAVASAAACQELTDSGERSAVAQGELVSGLVAAYGFEEGGGATTADSSGNNLAGSLAGTAWVTTGKFGKALSFNGSSSIVSIPDAGVLDLTTGMTLSAWIKPTTLRGWPCVIMKERAGELTYALYASSPDSRPNIDYTHNGF